jgi:hypothetical protein
MAGGLVKFPQTVSLELQEIVGSNRGGVITAWLSKHPGSRARFRVRVRDLRKIPRVEWTIKQFRYLEAGLSEIKWEFEKRTWRAVGFDRKGFFVMVLGCTHKDGVYDPSDWLKTSKKRKTETEQGLWGIVNYEP